jgi:uroporphyrinogen decarboxylase
VLTLVRACKQAGVDGFYASTQGGEAFRFKGTDIFERLIKPTDLAVWDEIGDCRFNILTSATTKARTTTCRPFLDYPGHVVNCSLEVGGQRLTPAEAAAMFKQAVHGRAGAEGRLATGTHGGGPPGRAGGACAGARVASSSPQTAPCRVTRRGIT